MIYKAVLSQTICIFIILLAASRPMVANAQYTSFFNENLESFSFNFFSKLIGENPRKNVFCSTFAIHASLGMARMGAESTTADEMDKALYYAKNQDPQDLADNYNEILANYQNSPILQIANKMYVMDGYCVKDQFNQSLKEKFYSSVEYVNFEDNVAAARTINTWVQSKTNNLIKDIVEPNSLNEAKELVLVSAMSLKATWSNQFHEQLTWQDDFHLDSTRTTKVEMMRYPMEINYGYLNGPWLKAEVLELPYANSDLAMLVIVPPKGTNVDNLAADLFNNRLSNIMAQLRPKKIILSLPKFKAEFQADLSQMLADINLGRMFSDNAQFDEILEEGSGLRVSSVIHKAFIEVNERGTDASAPARVNSFKNSSAADFEMIKANRPFIYIIKNADNVMLFQGVYKGTSN